MYNIHYILLGKNVMNLASPNYSPSFIYVYIGFPFRKIILDIIFKIRYLF